MQEGGILREKKRYGFKSNYEERKNNPERKLVFGFFNRSVTELLNKN
jgi:hypothetical protein